jgi:hypothetical protein
LIDVERLCAFAVTGVADVVSLEIGERRHTNERWLSCARETRLRKTAAGEVNLDLGRGGTWLAINPTFRNEGQGGDVTPCTPQIVEKTFAT